MKQPRAKQQTKKRKAEEKHQTTIHIDHQLTFTNPLVLGFIKLDSGVPEYRAIFTFKQGEFITEGENLMNTMQAGTAARLSVKWTDTYGNDAKVDGPTEWQSSDNQTASVDVAVDDPKALSATVRSNGPIGPVQIQATADADLGSGMQTITATCDINVIAGEASGGEIDFESGSTPQPIRKNGKKAGKDTGKDETK